MSIIFIDDILFNDNNEERKIRNNNCILFMTINSLSIFSGIFYLYLYFIIPFYHNSSNALSLYLCIFHLILNVIYFFVFLDFYLYKSLDLSILLKLIAIFNPLIIFCVYYWIACLTHNLYAIFYKYINNINARVKFYKYLLFIISLVFFICTLINIHYNNSKILSKDFYLINNYNNSFTDLFYICGIFMIFYIIIKLYYILKKKKEFISSINNQSQENLERVEKIKKIFNSVLNINLSFIIYFLFTLTPTNILMLFKYNISSIRSNTYFIDFITIFLISFSGTFIFCMRLLDPFMRNFTINLICMNKEYISNFKEKLLRDNSLNESFDENNLYDLYNIYKNFSDNAFKRSIRKTKTIQSNNISLNFRKSNINDNKKNCQFQSKKKKLSIVQILEMDEISNDDSFINENEENNYKEKKNKIKNENNFITTNKNEEDENDGNDSFNSNDIDNNEMRNETIQNLIVRKSHNNNNLHRAHTNSDNLLKFHSSPINLLIKKHNDNKKKNVLNEEIQSFDLMNFHLEMNDNLIRLIAISISINDCRIYDDINEYKRYYNSTIPWDNKNLYNEITSFKEYNEKNIPNWLDLNSLKINNIAFKIQSFCPFVFHHIRLLDNISIDDILSSLDPVKNMKTIQDMKVEGGRGGNSIIYSWDKKLILKTANTTEIKILIEKMIVDYHCLMKSKTLLSRIYGAFKIEFKDKGIIYVIIQRNMNDLPNQTKLLTFDFKGSTVDRQSIKNEDSKLDKKDLMNKYKNIVLKDLDIGILDLKILLNFNDWKYLISMIDSDSMLLETFQVTDYSLVVFVHKYRKEDLDNKISHSRIFSSKDNKYLFNFAIVDFLGTFNIGKKGEKLAKEFVGYIKNLKDTNFSVLDPERYAKRFRNFLKKIIKED